MPVAIINVTITRAPAVNVVVTRAPAVNVTVTYPGRIIETSGGGLPTMTDGMAIVYRPVAGKLYVFNKTTNDYQELIALRQSGVDRLTLDSPHLDFSELPAA